MQPAQLSKADSKVLAQVFDPESAPERTEILVDPSLPQDRHITNPTLFATLRKREAEAIKLIEEYEKSATGPTSSNSNNNNNKDQTFRSALTKLDALIADYPNYASARNNRAQLRRWRFGDRNLICQRRSTFDQDRKEAAAGIVEDLTKCISLASPARPTDAIAPGQGRVLAQANTQLGAVLHAASKDLEVIVKSSSSSSSATNDGMGLDLSTPPTPFDNFTEQVQFEEEASRLFYLGGLYGNEVAKALAVHTNPHAKLCGNIVQEAMRKEMMMSEA